MNNQLTMKPDHSMTVTLITPNQAEILALLDSFANEHSLKLTYGYRSPDGKDFLLQMSSNRLNITAIKLPDENFYRIASYIDRAAGALKPMTTELMNDLRNRLEIMGAKVMVEY